MLLPRAEQNIEKLQYEPVSIEQLATLILTAKKYYQHIGQSAYEIILEKLLQSIGIRYSTVKSVLSKYENKSEANKNHVNKKEYAVKEPTSKLPIMVKTTFEKEK